MLDVIRNKVDNSISRIQLDLSNVVFDIELRGHITVFDGYSSTGKTFFMNSIKNYYFSNENYIRTYFGIDKMLFLNYSNYYDDTDSILLTRVKNMRNSLIFIDNADMLLMKNLKFLKYISYDIYNQYIIMSRGGVGLPVSPNHFCDLKKDGNRIYNEFIATVLGWM